VTRAQAALFAAIEALVDERVDARLRELGAAGTEYTSDNRPAGVSRRTFNTVCRTAVRGARKDGRTWSCTVAAWREARAGKPAPKPTLTLVSNDEADLDALLAASGMRGTR
jgi:hypothetical protein